MAQMVTLANLDLPLLLSMPCSSTHLPGTLLSPSLMLMTLYYLGIMPSSQSPGPMSLLEWLLVFLLPWFHPQSGQS